MHTGLFRAFYFYQKPRYGQKTKKNKCLRANPDFLLPPGAEIWPKNKKKFGNLATSPCAGLKGDSFKPIPSFLLLPEAKI
ncbi:hypothetical protein PUN28_011914 [Cardiocondyla obscurior]|uniref:Uncharacterized protein n=1 Tax=Cardiocondyla obscurior TaxID=286306 RepID=A0AAW2FIK0_9HYME